MTKILIATEAGPTILASKSRQVEFAEHEKVPYRSRPENEAYCLAATTSINFSP